MYSFEPNEEQKMLTEAVYRYAFNDLRANAHTAEEEAGFAETLIEKGWELGYLQASISEDYGGFGERSAVTGVLALEEMSWGDLAGTLAVMAPNLFGVPIALVGSTQQKERFLSAIVAADWKPYSAAMIEPEFDFDPNELRTVAETSGKSYLITGEKVFVPFANQARWMIVYARLGEETQAFIVPGESEGLSIGDRQKLMGIHALPVYKVSFNKVRVPRENRLGGTAGHPITPLIASMHLATAAMAIGLSRAAYEYSREYAKEREVFGVKVAQKQAIAFMLAEIATEIEAIRLLTWEAAWKLDAGKADAAQSAYLAFSGAADMAMMVTDRAVQILGGHGYIREHPVELWMRNGRGIAAFTGLAIV